MPNGKRSAYEHTRTHPAVDTSSAAYAGGRQTEFAGEESEDDG
jgi:hypothetical protein